MVNKKFVFSFLLLLIFLLLQACSSMTDVVVKPQSLNERIPYAEIRFSNGGSTNGQLISMSRSHNSKLSEWEKFSGGDSTGKAIAKLAYSLTPWGMLTNLSSGKGLLGATVYHVPSGHVKLLVFNYYSRIVNAGTTAVDEATRLDNLQKDINKQKNMAENNSNNSSAPKKRYLVEFSHWGSILTAQLEPGKTYYLTAQKFPTGKSGANEIFAFTSLLDKDGSDVVSRYILLTAPDEVTMKSLTIEMSDLKPNAPAGLQGINMANELMPGVGKYFEELGQFIKDVDAGTYDAITSSWAGNTE